MVEYIAFQTVTDMVSDASMMRPTRSETLVHLGPPSWSATGGVVIGVPTDVDDDPDDAGTSLSVQGVVPTTPPAGPHRWV